MRWPRGLAAALLGSLVALSCSAPTERAPGPLRIVATTMVLGEFARDVAGPDAQVNVLIPPGSDPHSFEAPTSAARDVAAADVLVVNGHRLEGGLLSVVGSNRSASARVIVAGAGIEALAGDEGETHGAGASGLPTEATSDGDPHMWLDPELAARYVETIADGLAAADPAGAPGYRERGQDRAARLRALKGEVATSLASIPPERRRIVVFHDAFAYFARAFDFQLSAGVLPEQGGREPSARALADTVALVRAQQVPAVYREPQFSPALLEAVGRETGARVLVLYSDAYGAEITGYDEMMRANARALVEGLARPSGQ